VFISRNTLRSTRIHVSRQDSYRPQITAMDDYKTQFLPLLLKANALSFGTFTLKSGRHSPYFFNSGKLCSRALAKALGQSFAKVLSEPPFSLPFGTDGGSEDGTEAEADGQMRPVFDVLFGPAYKGIPMAGIVVSHLPDNGHFDDVNYSFNRKEVKDHGEGGSIGGAPLKGKKVCIIDDVLTAGTALREAVSIIKAQGGEVVGVVLLLTRQERVSDSEPRSAVKVAEDELGVPVRAVLTFQDLIDAIQHGKIEGVGEKELAEMKKYREVYGSRD
jgi:orotate phosphoribosyltransferase